MRKRIRPGSVLAVLLLAAMPAWAGPAAIPPGDGRQQAELAGRALPVFTYRPDGCAPRVLLLVFHGMSRNAAAYRAHARSLADRACAILFAPQFDRTQFPRALYQYGGTAREPPGQRTTDLIPGLIAWARAGAGAPGLPVILLGHSAGAQFLDRVAALTPTGATAIIVANPLTWVLPSTETKVPFGFGDSGGDPEAALRPYLAAPVAVLLGGADTGSKYLATSPQAMAQGPNRLERGRNAFRMAQQVAGEHGWAFGWTLTEIPAVGHDATAMFGSAQAFASVERGLAASR